MDASDPGLLEGPLAGADDEPSVDVVVPTIGRASLAGVVVALARQRFPGRVFVVDDRRDTSRPLPLECSLRDALDIIELRSGSRGPAAARNVGWRASSADWIAFLDDDVIPGAGWWQQLRIDLAGLDHDVAGSQGRVIVPLPNDRRPTDWERNVAGLGTASWVTADMAYRRRALRALGGFDERFRRAYREDADLGIRALAGGWRLTVGCRRIVHPVRPAPWHVSIANQRGNADDALMSRVHGSAWREMASAPRGAFRSHVAVTVAAAAAVAAAVARRPGIAILGALTWLLATLRFMARRLRGTSRDPKDAAAMAITSVVIPPVAVWHRLVGTLRAGRLVRRTVGRGRVAAVLFDRDGTLIEDVPYNGDPAAVAVVPGARHALDRLRAAGIRIGVVTNQSGVARGLVSRAQVEEVNTRLVQLLGPIDVIAVCEHGQDAGCDCRKPAPGLVLRAAAQLGVPAARCAVVGDIGTDVEAAAAAGASAILVPNAATRRDEITAASCVAGDLATAVDLLLGATT